MRIKLRLISAAMIILITFMHVPGVGQAAPPAAPTADEVVVPDGSSVEIAVSVMSGYGGYQDLLDVVGLAIDDHGPIQGFDVNLTPFDDPCNQSAGAALGQAIAANPQIVGLIGPMCSVTSRTAVPELETAGVVVISMSNTQPNLYPYGPTVYNRVVTNDPYFEPWESLMQQDPQVLAWEAQFADDHGHAPDLFAKHTYDATRLLLDRIDGIASIDGTGSLVIPRPDLRRAVRLTRSFEGITGNVTLDGFGDRINHLVEAVWLDEFNAPLQAALQTVHAPSWIWLDEDPTHWSLTARPGFMRIITQQITTNQYLQPAPKGNFELRAYLEFTPTENFQYGGIQVILNADNVLRIGRAYCSNPFCVGNGIYFDHIEGGSWVEPNYATAAAEPTATYLRLVRSGNDYTAYYSPDGMDWIEIGTHTLGFKPEGVGLYASNQGATLTEINADYDWFLVEAANTWNWLPLSFGR